MRLALNQKHAFRTFPPMKKLSILLVCLIALACNDETESGSVADASGSGEPMLDLGVTDIFVVETMPLDGGMADSTPSAPSVCIEPPEIVDVPVRLETNCRSGNQPKRIQDYRNYRCEDYFRFGPSDPDNGRSENSINVVLDEVVVTGVFETDFSVQDVGGGAFSGLWVYTDRRTYHSQLTSTRLRLSGQLMEFYGLTELRLDNDDDAMRQVGIGAPPEPIVVTDSTLIADEGYLAKELESLLVSVPGRFVVSTSPDCPFDYDMFVIGGGLRVEDEAGLSYEPKRGDFVDRVTGIVHYSFSHQKVLPRIDQDLRVTACGGVPDKCDAAECIFEIGAIETGQLMITEIQDDPRGADGPREYVELYNGSAEAVDLSGWRLQNCTDMSVALSGRVEPGGYYVVAGSLSRNENGGINADLELSGLNLPNGKGSLLLIDAEGALVDQVRYDDATPWPVREDGESLEVLTLTGDNSNGAVWRPGTSEYGDGGWGTPGQPNR